MPPTSIDGTDITGATIDGTDVTEITVDGQTVFTSAPPAAQIFQPVSGDENAFSGEYDIALFFIKQGNFGGGEIVASDSITTTLGDDYELSLTLFNDSSVEASINDFNTTLSTISVGPQNAPGNTPSLSLGTNRLSFTDTEVFYANCRSIVL